MCTNPTIKLKDYYFFDQASWYERLAFRPPKSLRSLFPIEFICPILKPKWSFWSGKFVPFIEAAKATGLYDETLHPNFRLHQKGFYNFLIYFIAMYLLVELPTVIAVVLGTVLLRQYLFISVHGLIYLFFQLLLLFSAISAAMRLASLILKRKFAEMLCVVGITYIFVILTRDDAILNMKEDLLYRLNSLANNLLLMGMNYSGSDDVNKKWTYDLFNKMSRFVRGLERAVIAPDENSLEKLRQGISNLGKIMISGQYGSFDFQISEIEKIDQRPKSLSIQIFTVIGKVISIAIPASVLIFMFTSIDAFNQLNINRDSVFYIAVAWLLLALDDLIGGIGFVEKFLNLVKVSKDLR